MRAIRFRALGNIGTRPVKTVNCQYGKGKVLDKDSWARKKEVEDPGLAKTLKAEITGKETSKESCVGRKRVSQKC